MNQPFICPGIFSALFLHAGVVLAESPPPIAPAKTIESCRFIPDAIARLKCFEEAASSLAAPASPLPSQNHVRSGWRLVRTPGAKPGGEVITMMRTAELLRSDPAFGGLALHCGESGPEILIIVLEPFPPRSKPQIEIGGQASGGVFEASVLPGGAALLLPGAATALVNGPWQALSELSVKVENAGSAIQGVVALSGLKEALDTITTVCSGNRQ